MGTSDMNTNVKGSEESLNEVCSEWTQRVVDTARELCSDPEGNHVNLDYNNSKFLYLGNDLGAMECIIKAIQKHLPAMPIIARLIFRGLLQTLESDIAKAKQAMLKKEKPSV